jgi:hypothetical protein
MTPKELISTSHFLKRLYSVTESSNWAALTADISEYELPNADEILADNTVVLIEETNIKQLDKQHHAYKKSHKKADPGYNDEYFQYIDARVKAISKAVQYSTKKGQTPTIDYVPLLFPMEGKTGELVFIGIDYLDRLYKAYYSQFHPESATDTEFPIIKFFILDYVTCTLISHYYGKTNETDTKEKEYDPMLDTLITSRAESLYMPKDKVTNSLFRPDSVIIADRLKDMATIWTGRKRQGPHALASVIFDHLKGVSYTKTLTEYDRDIVGAVISLLEAGNQTMTTDMIYRTMTGNEKAKTTQHNRDEILASLRKLGSTRMRLDATNEAKAYNLNGKLTYEGAILEWRMVDAYVNGRRLGDCIRILEPPMLWDYACRKKQVATFTPRLLNTPVSKTTETISIQSYLLRRIDRGKNGKEKTKMITISIDTLIKQTSLGIEQGTDEPDECYKVRAKKKRAKIRTHIKTILEYWKKERYISGYENQKKGKTIHSITIFL